MGGGCPFLLLLLFPERSYWPCGKADIIGRHAHCTHSPHIVATAKDDFFQLSGRSLRSLLFCVISVAGHTPPPSPLTDTESVGCIDVTGGLGSVRCSYCLSFPFFPPLSFLRCPCLVCCPICFLRWGGGKKKGKQKHDFSASCPNGGEILLV